jgi:hypothetical protein
MVCNCLKGLYCTVKKRMKLFEGETVDNLFDKIVEFEKADE